ncbi:unnamed protein product [Moneuplotes crassus]|uniref:BZIP domain-containing protein n=1 Tax=Euplotes crassus TaxID=5936 RepID=A0AAD1XLH6_EUPCR|nr:unnamed protein product [Moneuplotes crassus]
MQHKKRTLKERAKKEKTLSIKERSKIHRERKKRYYQELEKKVADLEEENRQLRAKLVRSLGEKDLGAGLGAGEKGSAQVLQEEEKNVYELYPKIIENNPSQFRMSMYETSRDLQGAFGTERVKVLKSAFNSIVENCIPSFFKVLLCAFNYIPCDRFFPLLRDRSKKHRSMYKFYRSEVPDKVYKNSTDASAGENSPSTEEIPDNTKILSQSCNAKELHQRRFRIEQALYSYPFSESVIDCWTKVGKKTRDYLKEVKHTIKDLVSVRNKLLRILSGLHDDFFESSMYESFTAQDVSTFGKLCCDLKGSDLLDPFMLYELKKPHSEEREEDEISWIGV